METSSAFPEQLAAEFKKIAASKLFEEYWPRIHTCLEECDDEMLWYRPNDSTNSIGNLVLHLEGNVRQWILHGISGQADIRKRRDEFDAEKRFAKEELIAKLKKLKEEVSGAIGEISSEELLVFRTIQGFQTTVMGALFHVVEHFSYHLGQISFLVKSMKDIDLGYYSDRDLD